MDNEKLAPLPWKKLLWLALGVMAIYIAVTAGCSKQIEALRAAHKLFRSVWFAAEWREEVQLSDGRIIEIIQKRHYEEGYDGNGRSRVVRESWLRFTLPETGNREIVWHENLVPMRLDVYEGKPFIVAYPPTGREFDKYGKPKPSYLGFAYDKNQWRRVPYRDIPEIQYDANLVIKWHPPGDVQKITLALKNSKQFNNHPYVDKSLKRIDPKFGKNW